MSFIMWDNMGQGWEAELVDNIPNIKIKRWFENRFFKGEYCLLRSDGSKMWYLDDKRHRLDGPAVEFPYGYREWLQCGILHRLDGPAIEYPDGKKGWYVNGEGYQESEYPAALINFYKKDIKL